jgi:hypothetical protein
MNRDPITWFGASSAGIESATNHTHKADTPKDTAERLLIIGILVLAPLAEEVIDTMHSRIAPGGAPPLVHRVRGIASLYIDANHPLRIRDHEVEHASRGKDPQALP